jgi:hypothetical protein
MRLSEYCTSQDVDRAIAVTVDSFVGAQKVSCKKALARAFAKYVFPCSPVSFCLPSEYALWKYRHEERRVADCFGRRYTLARPTSQRNGRGRGRGREGARATAVMA